MPTVTLRPIANDTPIELLPEPSTVVNWDCVDEEPPNDSTDYVYLPGEVEPVEGRDVYDLPDSGIPSGSTINSVTVVTRARKTIAAVAASVQPLLKIVGTIYYGISSPLTTTWTTFSQTWTTSPATGSPWTLEEINTLKAGVRLAVDVEPCVAECTYLRIDVDYTPPPPAVVLRPIRKMDLGPHPRSRFLFTPTMILKGVGAPLPLWDEWDCLWVAVL